MATETKTIKKCDVYGVTRGVETFTVCVKGELGDEIIDSEVDLCHRAAERMMRMINAAIRPPRRKAKGALPL